MVQQEQETRTTRTLAELLARHFTTNIDFLNLLSSREQERFAEWDILREIGEEYEPLDESRLRIIDIQRRVVRTPRLDRIILETMAKLREEVADLRQRVEELTEVVRGTSKIYNATIHELGDSRVELAVPLQIVLEEDQEETVARIPELNLYTSGDTDNEAINELKQEVIRLYEELESSNKKLGPLPKSWLLTLRKLIVKKNG